LPTGNSLGLRRSESWCGRSGAVAEGEEEPARQAGGQGLLAGGVDEELHGGETLAGYALGLEDLGRLLGQGLDLG